jgi:hypothetical protein
MTFRTLAIFKETLSGVEIAKSLIIISFFNHFFIVYVFFLNYFSLFWFSSLEIQFGNPIIY